MSDTPPGIRCSVCGGTFMGYHSCGGAKPLSNLPEREFKFFSLDEERKELHRLRAENQQLRLSLEAAKAENAKLRREIVNMVIPYEALRADDGSRKWIAPELWKHIVEATETARAMASRSGQRETA